MLAGVLLRGWQQATAVEWKSKRKIDPELRWRGEGSASDIFAVVASSLCLFCFFAVSVFLRRCKDTQVQLSFAHDTSALRSSFACIWSDKGRRGRGGGVHVTNGFGPGQPTRSSQRRRGSVDEGVLGQTPVIVSSLPLALFFLGFLGGHIVFEPVQGCTVVISCVCPRHRS